MFNNFSLSNDEILKIVDDYKSLIKRCSTINFNFDEDLYQEIILNIYIRLSENRKN